MFGLCNSGALVALNTRDDFRHTNQRSDRIGATMKRSVLSIACSACLLTSSTGFADVRSLTSSELTETYIEDSTIIVTPAQKPSQEVPRKIVTYTLGPSEPVITEEEAQAALVQERENFRARTDIAEESARQVIEGLAAIERQPLPTLPALTERTINIPNNPGLVIPEGPFNMPLIGENLGLSSDGQRLTLSIGGNLQGVDPIVLQEIQSQLINLQQRPNGVYDLTIDIPQR